MLDDGAGRSPSRAAAPSLRDALRAPWTAPAQPDEIDPAGGLQSERHKKSGRCARMHPNEPSENPSKNGNESQREESSRKPSATILILKESALTQLKPTTTPIRHLLQNQSNSRPGSCYRVEYGERKSAKNSAGKAHSLV